MSGFEASTAVSPLDFNFMPYIDAKGTIPEPSQDAIRIFQKAVRRVSPDGEPTKLSELSDEEAEEVNTTMRTALSAFCQGQPSAEEIAALPHRVMLAFVGWLFGSFSNPTSQTAATKS